MPYAKSRTTNSDLPRRTVRRTAVAAGLIVLGVLVFASLGVSSRSVGAATDRAKGRAMTDRGNPRTSERSQATANNMAPTPLLTVDVDRTDDDPLALTCTVAPNDCSLRGAVAFANLVPGTVINVPAGTYQLNIPGGAPEGFSGNNSVGDLDVRGNNTSITGAGAATTIIQQTQPNDRVLEVNPDLLASFNFAISGVTISGGRETTGVGGGGIVSGAINNTMSVTNCVVSGNSATGAGTFGGGGIMNQGGSLTLTGTTFSGNSTTTSGGGLSYTAGDPLIRMPSNGTLSVSGSTFSGNTANSFAAGGGGADLFNFNNSISTYNINSSTFSGNTAPNANGGAIVVESGPLTLTTSSLSGNSAVRGGAIYSSGSASVRYSRLVGNSVPTPINGMTLFTTNNAFTADDDWWGINTGPSGNDFRSPTGTILPLTYLQLRASASPNEICTGQSSTVTADIKQRNDGAPLTTELNGLPAFPVPPATIFNNAVLGTLSGASTQFVDGVATATYTAGGTTGMGSVDATADNQTVTATINISANETTDPANVSVCQGQDATFSTTASGPGPFSYAWTLDGSPFNGDSPSITVPTGSLSFGDHTVVVTVTGACSTVSQSATLTVNGNTVASDPADVTVCQGATASFATTASGGNLHYAWTLDGSPFNGDASSIDVPTGSLSAGTHSIGLTVTGSCGSVSHTANLVVQANTVASDPVDVTLCQGGTANFSTTASGEDIHYAWTLDGSEFNGDASSISVPTGSLSVGTHTIGLTVTGECGPITHTASLVVQANTVASDPADVTVCQGGLANFSTTASGTDLHYAWTLDGSPFNGDASSISVPTGSLSVGTHSIGLTVTGACGSVSHTANLVVQANTVASDPADVTVCQGATANFATTASGENIHYAWTLDGSPFNGDASSISVPTGSLSVGTHSIGLTVTGECGMVSHTATLTVQAPTGTTDPADVAVCQGQDAHFSTTASGTGPFSYAWTLDGNPYNGDSPSITVPTGSLSPGNHTVTVTTTGACGSAVQSATLTVGGAPVIVLSTSSTSMWPPNHQYQTFNVNNFVASASSGCDPNVDANDVVIVSVSSDEPENSTGADGNTLNDIVIEANCKSVNLRRERDSNLNGRVYTITFKVTDSSGNFTTATAKVSVPINQNGGGAVDDGAAAGYTVNSLCP